MSTRWSLANPLRQLRGARGSSTLSAIRYGKHRLAVLYIEACIIDLNRAEAKLMKARALVRAAASSKRTKTRRAA